MDIDAEYARHMLRRICQNASKKAKAKGFKIDFEKCLYISAGVYAWYMYVFDTTYDVSYGVFTKDENAKRMMFGVEFMRYVLAIDRFEGADKKECEKSPIAMMRTGIICLPVVDEFAYKFPANAMKIMLNSMMTHGAYVSIANPRASEADEILHKFEKNMKVKMQHEAEMLGSKNPAFAKFTSTMLHEYKELVNKLHSMKAPIEVDIVSRPCKCIEELEMLLDLEEVE